MKNLILAVVLTAAVFAGAVGRAKAGAVTNLVTVTNDMTRAWQWKTQFLFSATAPAGASIEGSSTNSYYDAGTTINLTATNTAYYKIFSYWTGLPNGVATNSANVNFNLTDARTNVAPVFVNRQYTLILRSAHGTIQPAQTNVVEWGTVVPASIESIVTNAPGVRGINMGLQ